MKIKLAVAAVILTSLFCCTQKKQTKAFAEQDTQKQKADSFFPVTSFLKGQLTIIDSLPITPLYKITVKEKMDSQWLKKDELRKFLQPFMSSEINETNLTSLFKETKFSDLSINAITFTYDPIAQLPDSVQLHHWDVYVNPETGVVNKIYLVKEFKEGKKNITQQLTWQTGKYAKIVSIETKPDESSEIMKEEEIIWSF
ncbi:hypothetical protein LK994_06695 [Ferruginibacter lapsinanis]|uniref:hypothetical protein n=1 Tax=Ferruginibacter lapsinanis TaxID=563172 RepID=UPI001E56B4AF|nr:hypothetical protein [Ferruginibacter lapsinanis]UEG51161.1 hypothetical protein LK994_06695 [Ferruginibacter lapsinanis]